MLKEGGSEDGGNWSEQSLKSRAVFLSKTWGNLVGRILSPKMDIRVAVSRVFDEQGKYIGVESLQPDQDEKLRIAIETAIDIYRFNMNNLNLRAALEVLDNLMRAVTFPSPFFSDILETVIDDG